MQGKQSISYKILKATLYCLIVVVAMTTAVAILTVTKTTNISSKTLVTQICDKETLRFNNELKLMEHSLVTIEEYMRDMEDIDGSKEHLLSQDFCNKVLDMTLSIVNRTDGAMAVYFRYNPELTGNGTQGFFYSRNNDTEKFAYFMPTNILKYDQHDIEHVGWFYEPKNKRRAIWMAPYYNKNIDVFMISYVIPYYTKTGTFLGVIGVDIDFNKILQLTGKVHIYQSGKINLIDLSTNKLYGINAKAATVEDNLSVALYNQITTINSKNEALVLRSSTGEEMLTCVRRLRNGMRLLLQVPVQEVNASRNNMLLIFAVIMLFFLVVTGSYMLRVTKKMTAPLRKLTRITGKYAEGNWDETYISNTNDEIQTLSESISTMAETTKSYIKKINASAMTDGLTGLKNKNCYLAYIDKLQADLTETSEYGLVVMDINFLKKVNDNYGHEQGDELIKQAGAYICRIFAHSPVFRIGGDEYNVILQKGDYDHREALYAQFLREMETLPHIVGDIPLSISIGVATYPADGKSYDDVFKCADERMYACKKRMKGGRE